MLSDTTEVGRAARPSPSMVDHFDRLPESLLLLVLNRLGDVKALGRCSAVSKRFSSLVPLVESVVVRVDCVISGDDDDPAASIAAPASSSSATTAASSAGSKPRGVVAHLFKLLLSSIILRPIQVIQQLIGLKRVILAEVSHHSPGEVLRCFTELRRLRIELPGGELGVDRGALLKWKAEFGSSLESCVILGATSFRRCDDSEAEESDSADSERDPNYGTDDQGSIPESFYTNGGLKLRVVWTITSLIAASARHYLLQQIVAEHPTLESLVLTDVDGQGMLCMGKEQLTEFRRSPIAPSTSSANRTQVPALNMKLWYAPRLKLASGYVMEGATLVAIRPIDWPIKKETTEAFIASAFDEPFGEAARAMVKRRTYLLEMNPF
ncbi:F-box protein At5g46170-like [Nymphaea colorata]|nr:F-box protein At5g46170-like [Nymphaea colorata]